MLDTDIRNRLAEYLRGETTLRSFQEWFIRETWDIQNLAPQHILDLVYSIKLKLAEYTSGHLTENEVRETLRQYVEHFTMVLSFPAAHPAMRPYRLTASSSRILGLEQDEPREVVLAL